MIPYERQEKILTILRERELIRIEELQQLIPEVSISTLRRDLKELEKVNKVQPLAGGAVKSYSGSLELPIKTKSTLQIKEKELIATIAAKEVLDGETVYIDSGSTCTILLKTLLQKPIHIVTTNTDIVRMTESFTAEVTMLGGTYNPNISSLSGPLTEATIQHYIFDRAFLGANGIDIKFGITTPNLAEAMKKRTVLKRTKQAYVVADSSKFHQSSAVKAFDLTEVTLITNKQDKELSKEMPLIY